jgi:hypothetical protein
MREGKSEASRASDFGCKALHRIEKNLFFELVNSRTAARGSEEGYGVDAGDVEALAAAGVFAHGLGIGQKHVALGFGELGPVAFVGSAGEAILLGADDVIQFVRVLRAAGRAVQSRRLFGLRL